MSKDLTGQRVLVIGGSRDLGLAVARAAAGAGAVVIIGARDEQKASDAASSIQNAEWVRMDVTDEASIEAGLAGAGKIDHIVVLTAAHHNVPVDRLDHDRTVAAFEAKVIGPLMVAKHAAGILPPTGSVVLFSGVAAWSPQKGFSVMGITNGAVSFAASHLAKDLAPIRVNAISPGIIDSGSWDAMGANKKKFLEDAAGGNLAGRWGASSDIADAVLWLLGATFVSGETIHVEGGARNA